MFNRNKSNHNARVFYKYHYYYVLVLQNTNKTSEDHLTLILESSNIQSLNVIINKCKKNNNKYRKSYGILKEF